LAEHHPDVAQKSNSKAFPFGSSVPPAEFSCRALRATNPDFPGNLCDSKQRLPDVLRAVVQILGQPRAQTRELRQNLVCNLEKSVVDRFGFDLS
jgi:hypothetical protein